MAEKTLILPASAADLEALARLDRHISREELFHSIARGRVLTAKSGARLTGWLRYNLFWDNTPFLNLLYILEEERGRGIGGALLRLWEERMAQAGHRLVMTSTLSNEPAQQFYRSHGYRDAGCLLLEGEPTELFLTKRL